MTAVSKNLYIEQGATFRLGFNWFHETDPPTDPPTPDLANPHLFPTGTLARMQVREFQGAPVLLEATTANGKIVLGPTNGRVDLIFTATDTDSLDTITAAVYDYEIESVDGDVTRLLQGSVVISPNVTRDIP